MKRYLVTGGCGFLGSHLVRALVNAGHFVVPFDDSSRGSRERLDDVQCWKHRGDVRDRESLGTALTMYTMDKKFDAVIHLAAVNGTKNFYENPSRVLEVGVKGVVNVMDACVAHGVRELFVASSSEVYQTPPVFPTPEGVPLVVPDPHNPRYSYGASKIITEMMALHYKSECFDRVVVFRPHNVYGPDMGEDHVIPQLIRKIRDADPERGPKVIELEGTGRETRSFCYVDDCVDGVMTLLEKGGHREVYNIGSGAELPARELARAVGMRMGHRPIGVKCVPLKAGSVPRRCPDVSKLRALGWEPKVTLAEGLERTVKWYLEHKTGAA